MDYQSHTNMDLQLLILVLMLNLPVRVKSLYCPKDDVKWARWAGDEKDCPSPGDRFLTNYDVLAVPWGTEGRAWYTVPPEIKIKNSTIPGIGYGAFAKTFIPRNTWLSEYEGEVVGSDKLISDYAWQIYQDDVPVHFIDAGKADTSNWVRWVNCARHRNEENVEAMYCMGKVFYITTSDVYPGQELFVYYGDEYAGALGIDTDLFT